MNKPFFCITSDIDWASEYCINDFLSILRQFNVKATLFATHDSAVIKEQMGKGTIDVGIHPNFASNTTQGKDEIDIIDNLLRLYPDAKSFRSHYFFDNYTILKAMLSRNINVDSNICLYLQPDIVPLNLGVGGTRYPVFWEDDVHWSKANFSWDFDDYLTPMMSSGIKIFNFHPFMVAANIPNAEYYKKIKPNITTLSAENIEEIRYKGKGARTFLIELLEKLSKTEKFYTLSDLSGLVKMEDYLLKESESEGKTSVHSEDEYHDYWAMDDAGRQKFVMESYKQRNALDLYATSRDFNMRELEIEIIRRQISVCGDILDIGCGNGYTLISLAKSLEKYGMTGVDFSANLISGAQQIMSENARDLKSTPNFIHADAIEFLKNAPAESYDYIITERFIQNLPSEQSQRDRVSDIFRVLKPNGKLLMCEGSAEGFDKLNEIRDGVGLDIISPTSKENVSAIRIQDTEFERYATEQVGYELAGKFGFSDYFLISRIFHPKYVKPQNPRFDSKINQLAKLIQENMPFEAGIGSNTLWVFQKK